MRYAVIRCPSPGPPALIDAPNVFDTKAEAESRIASIEAQHRKSHHTFLAILPIDGPLFEALDREGVMY